MSKVVVTDHTWSVLDVETAILEPLGCRVVARQCRTTAELIDLVADADYVLTQFAPIREEVIAAMRQTRLIVRYGIGVDNVDLEAARARGIPVCNVPDYCIDEVADHTLAFMLAATRQVVANCLAVRGGKWGLAVPLGAMRTLRDLTVGIIGLGRIGREVARRASAFKCRLLAHDPAVPAAEIERLGCTPASLDEVLTGSDVLTLHCPSNAQTRRLLNQRTLTRMKDGAILVNVGRGDLVDTAALVEALRQGKLAAAALDVCDPEPIPADSPLLQMDNVIVSAHVASASVKAVKALREGVAHAVARALRGEPLPNVVNGVRA
jgi:D-3-phosphoglycerate dehydrogenase